MEFLNRFSLRSVIQVSYLQRKQSSYYGLLDSRVVAVVSEQVLTSPKNDLGLFLTSEFFTTSLLLDSITYLKYLFLQTRLLLVEIVSSLMVQQKS